MNIRNQFCFRLLISAAVCFYAFVGAASSLWVFDPKAASYKTCILISGFGFRSLSSAHCRVDSHKGQRSFGRLNKPNTHTHTHRIIASQSHNRCLQMAFASLTKKKFNRKLVSDSRRATFYPFCSPFALLWHFCLQMSFCRSLFPSSFLYNFLFFSRSTGRMFLSLSFWFDCGRFVFSGVFAAVDHFRLIFLSFFTFTWSEVARTAARLGRGSLLQRFIVHIFVF